MPTLNPGLVHTPVTPFRGDGSIDFDGYSRLIEFHLKHGAQSLALPMHAGESVSLTDAEREKLLEHAIRQVKGRVPVIAHVSQSGTAVAASLARHAENTGAAAVVATTPYYWTPPPGMLLEHFAAIAAAVRIPLYVYNSPLEMGGVKVTADLALKLLQMRENFAGVVDASLDWQFMIEIVSGARRVRPDFQFFTALEYMISARAIGGSGAFAPMAGIAPNLVGNVYQLCSKEKYRDARKGQEELAALRQVVKAGGVAALKAAMRFMDRDCGTVRAPNEPLTQADDYRLREGLAALPGLKAEPQGW